jgi:hypothetical protein
MSHVEKVAFVPVAQVRAAISALGFDPDSVYAMEITLSEITVHYHDRYNGRLTGGRAFLTVPIERRAQP